jgi:hypothetical protein
MSLIVVFPTMPDLAVERMRVTLPFGGRLVLRPDHGNMSRREILTRATVMTDGLGMYANPDRFGSPALAVELIMTPVTLNPFKPLRPKPVSC